MICNPNVPLRWFLGLKASSGGSRGGWDPFYGFQSFGIETEVNPKFIQIPTKMCTQIHPKSIPNLFVAQKAPNGGPRRGPWEPAFGCHLVNQASKQ